MNYCCYYQARVQKADTWFLVAVLRSFEHIAFDRTLDKIEGIFEFFVPEAHEHIFLELMDYFLKEHVVFDVKKLSNRLEGDLDL